MGLTVVQHGRALGARFERQRIALSMTGEEITAWMRNRAAEGWSAYEMARILQMNEGAVRRKLVREGIPYTPKPPGSKPWVDRRARDLKPVNHKRRPVDA